ncbi:MAG: polysaccharide deacetylase family protein [Candidatus Omnitrophota bacterium]
MKKILLALCSVLVAGAIFLFFWLPGLYVVPVLVYHSVDIAKTPRERANTVSPQAFERQMSFIKKNGYRVLTADAYADFIRQGRGFPPKSVLITFDDGMLNNYTAAYPVLRQKGIPAVMFVIAGDVGVSSGPWQGPQMNWDQLREMSAQGITIASHTLTHAYLPEVSLDRARRELVESKSLLEKKLGYPVYYLAYPTGGFSDEIKTIAREAGYRLAFTTNRGYDRRNRDVFELKRIRPKDTDGSLVLWMKLSGYYNLLRDSKNSQ